MRGDTQQQFSIAYAGRAAGVSTVDFVNHDQCVRPVFFADLQEPSAARFFTAFFATFLAGAAVFFATFFNHSQTP
jgi:hypothetical protein